MNWGDKPIIAPSYLTIKDPLVFATIIFVVVLNDTFIPLEKFAEDSVSIFLMFQDIAYFNQNNFLASSFLLLNYFFNIDDLVFVFASRALWTWFAVFSET